jgi:NAD(P)H dehydrogenase (quinone)
VLKNLRAAGHTVDDCDLYAEGFNPVMSREERLGYHDVPANQAAMAVRGSAAWAEAIVFCFPTWCFGLPAMLKGFFDRSDAGRGLRHQRPGERQADAHAHQAHRRRGHLRPPALDGLVHGRPAAQDRHALLLRLTGNQGARVDYHAYYHMNVATEPQLKRFA